MDKKRRSIASTILLWTVVVAMAPLLIMTIQGYHCARQAVLQLKMNQLETVSMAKQRRIADWLDERARELQGHTAIADEEACACRSEELLALNPAYKSITLYSKDWFRLAATGLDTHDDEMLLPPAFKQALAESQEPAVSRPHIHENGLIGIHIGVPIPGKQQYVVAVLDLSSTLYPVLAEPLGTDHTVRSFIATAEGTLLDPTKPGTESFIENAALPPTMDSGMPHPRIYTGSRGEKMVGVSVALDDLGWVLVSEAPARDAFAWVGVLRTRAAATGLATLVLVVILAGQSAHRVTLPLRHLADVAHTVSSGQYTTRMQEFPGREHTEVAEAFNSMLDEINRTQARLAQSAALSAIGQLSASIVHEMRNPLSAIKMNLQVLQKKFGDDPLHLELAEIASDQVNRLETMLSDLLQYGKKLELDITAVDFAAFKEEVLRCIRPPAEGKQVAVTMENTGPGNTLYIDREHMLRAVCNLADNAVHETPDGGSVSIVVSPSETEPDAISITVSDTGPGIPARVAEKLFEPFFTTKENGVGLGLPNVKKIIELHGGSIAFRNGDAGGAVFTINLPTHGNHA